MLALTVLTNEENEFLVKLRIETKNLSSRKR